MRALLIDPSKDIDEFITEIDIESWKDITPTIGGNCNVFDCVRVDDDHTLYVDDEGLFNGAAQEPGCFALRDYPQPLAGRGVIQGIDNDTGESTPCELSIEEAQKKIGFLTPIGPVFMA